MSQANRAETMATKLAEYARRAGIHAGMLVAAYETSIQLRTRILTDVFHPDLLHPARTALILMEDALCNDDVVLTAAMLVDTEYAELQLAAADIREEFGDRVAGLVDAVPQPRHNELLLEELVSAPHDVALIAVAERLDHARHLHFRDAALWPAFFAQIRDVYLPASSRVSERLHQRLDFWSRAFEERRLS